MKVVINGRFGGFGLSPAGEDEILRRGGETVNVWNIPRTDPILVEMITENSELYSDDHADLHVVEVPDDVQWHIDNYDGREHVAENHRIWQ